jgi:hypothetical protein
MDTVPSTPDPTLVALVCVLIRYVLAGLSVFGLYNGALNDGQLMMAASTAVGIATVGWAIIERIALSRHTHATAIASSIAGKPVQPKS